MPLWPRPGVGRRSWPAWAGPTLLLCAPRPPCTRLGTSSLRAHAFRVSLPRGPRLVTPGLPLKCCPLTCHLGSCGSGQLQLAGGVSESSAALPTCQAVICGAGGFRGSGERTQVVPCEKEPWARHPKCPRLSRPVSHTTP